MDTVVGQLLQRREGAVARGINQMHPVYIQRAENAVIYDVNNRRYIDFSGGIAALNTGHLHPKIIAAVERQLHQFTHSCFAATPYESYIAVCERINALMPGNFDRRSFLLTTGSEAVESALKVARAATRRSGVIVFSGAYHGRTFMTLAMNGKIAPYSQGMGIMPGPVFRAPFPQGETEPDIAQALAGLKTILTSDIAPQDVAAIVIEPVQGEGGFYVVPPAFMRGLRELCDQEGIVLIADEVQSGAGRTGTFFAMEQTGVDADLIVFGKSVAGGLPLSGVVGRESLINQVAPGGLGGTWAGNPLSCAAALAVLDLFEETDLLGAARRLGQRLRKALESIVSPLAIGYEIRGVGAMIALELFSLEHGKRTPATGLIDRLVKSCAREGLILLKCGKQANAIRFLMPLTIEDSVLDEGLTIFAGALQQQLASSGLAEVKRYGAV